MVAPQMFSLDGKLMGCTFVFGVLWTCALFVLASLFMLNTHQMDDDDAINSKGTPAQLPPAYRVNHACAPTLPSPSATGKQRRRCHSETTSSDGIGVNSSSNSTGTGSSDGTGNDRQRSASSSSSTGQHEASTCYDAVPAETAPRIEDVAMHAKLSLTEGEV